MDPKAHLQQLHEAAERISGNLVELEIDAGRRLLETSALEGRSAERWLGASDALTELWRRQGLLEDLLQRADKLRSGQLGALLDNQSIELDRAEVPLSQRQLLAGSAAVETCSPDELVLGMSELFNGVTAAISDIGHAWDALLPKLETARRLAREAATLAADLGPSAEPELEQASRDLDRIGSQVGCDPLSVTDESVDQLVEELQTLNGEFEDSAALKRGLEARIFEARELLTRLQATIAEADDARAELLVKIVSPAPVSTSHIAGERARQLTHVSELAAQGNWREARRALDEWTAETNGDLNAAGRARDCNRAPIDSRNQLRALLDAYAVKAKRLGRLEDPEVEPLLRAAHDALYSAPTDLARAAQLVRSYQQSLSGAARPPEVNA